jgi:beta-phosphoglucomutase
MEKRAIIWDMDGTILDSTRLHFKAWQAVLKPYGIEYDWDWFLKNYGRTNQVITRELLPDACQQETETLADAQSIWFRAHARDNVQLLPGVIHWLEQFKSRGFLQAIATSSALLNAQTLTKILGIESFFDNLFTAEGMPSKPDPAVFLHAASSLNIPAERCLVIEDSPQGVIAAFQAGMKSIAVQTSGNTREDLKLASWIVQDLAQLQAEDVDRILTID